MGEGGIGYDITVLYTHTPTHTYTYIYIEVTLLPPAFTYTHTYLYIYTVPIYSTLFLFSGRRIVGSSRRVGARSVCWRVKVFEGLAIDMHSSL